MQKSLPEAALRITALTPRAFATVLAVVCSFVAANLARGQTWTLTGANANSYWTSVASSADGTKLAATANAGNGICLSTNSGVAWVTSSAPIVAWSSIASSSDGRRLIAAEGSVYISTNSGSTWNLSIPTGNRVASSADGSKLMVAQALGYGLGLISISTNAGVSWFLGTNNGTTLSRSWSTIACSADGTRMAAVVNIDDCPVFVSTNCGVTWHLAPGIIGQPGAAIACTADGSKLMLATAGMFYTSTSWGSTWSSTNYNAPFGDSMASSANGSTLMSVGFDSALDSSTNFGASWVSNNVPPSRLTTFACSADGHEVLAAQDPGGIWILKTPPSPQLNESLSNGSLTLSWIVPSTNMAPAESPDLINWTHLTNAPTLKDSTLEEQLTISPTNPGGFFRLQSY